MRYYLEILDERILALFTKFSHWFQRLTGRTNYFLAKVFLFVAVYCQLLVILNYWFRILTAPSNLVDIVLGSLLICTAAENAITADKAESHLFSEHETKPYIGVFVDKYVRIFAIAITIFGLATGAFLWSEVVQKRSLLLDTIVGLWWVYCLSAIYFASVDPLPPGKSKVRRWLEELQAGLRKLQPMERPNR